jgi:hypothetical protein
MNKIEDMISEMIDIKKTLKIADKEELLEHHLPEKPADLQMITEVQNFLNVKFSDEYIDFLTKANGWKGFLQSIDLFGTYDFKSNKMQQARELLEIDIEYIDFFKDIKDYLLPIGKNTMDCDLFIMILAPNEDYGKIIWTAEGEVERFDSFNHFFEEMIKYNKDDLEIFINDNQH